MPKHSGATETGGQQATGAPSPTTYTDTQSQNPSPTRASRDRHVHSQTTDRHWDRATSLPCASTLGPLRAKVASEEGEGPTSGEQPPGQVAPSIDAEGLGHIWGRGLWLRPLGWAGQVPPQTASGETKAARQHRRPQTQGCQAPLVRRV